jgi:hypothetical protein
MTPDVLQAPRLPALYREVFRYAGLPLAPESAPAERFVLRCGEQPPGLFAALLEEAFLEDEAEVVVWDAGDPPDFPRLPPGQLQAAPVHVGPDGLAGWPDPAGQFQGDGPGAAAGVQAAHPLPEPGPAEQPARRRPLDLGEQPQPLGALVAAPQDVLAQV